MLDTDLEVELVRTLLPSVGPSRTPLLEPNTREICRSGGLPDRLGPSLSRCVRRSHDVSALRVVRLEVGTANYSSVRLEAATVGLIRAVPDECHVGVHDTPG